MVTLAGSARGTARTLCIDVGAGGLAARVHSAAGKPVGERARADTPRPATPRAVCAALRTLLPPRESFDRVSVAFPGVVVDGVVQAAPGLHRGWAGFDLATWTLRATGRPTRVLDVAGVQGYGVIRGLGTEICLVLGVELGFALFVDGRLVPNVELGRHPFRKGKTYGELLGQAGLDKRGRKRWNRAVGQALEQLRETFHFRTLHLGGGNARFVKIPLPGTVRRVDLGLAPAGGVKLWGRSA